MKNKPSDQIELDFEGADKGFGEKVGAVRGDFKYFHPLCLCNQDQKPGRTVADVLSFADKVAQKQQETDSKLYEGILSRIKHLQL